jgi:hypothetical protein
MAFLGFIITLNISMNQEILSAFILWVSTHRFPPLPPQTRPDELQEVIIRTSNRREMFFIMLVLHLFQSFKIIPFVG